MSNLPALFISHGSPMLAIQDSPARRFLIELGRQLPRPKAILVASAHWETRSQPTLGLASHPETIHDFGGFPAPLYEIDYPAPGSPELAEHSVQLLQDAGIAAGRNASRGLDHGAWVPLCLIYPDADIPTVQISILRGASPAMHHTLGRALAGLRQEGVLVIGSGALTHNLYELAGNDMDAPVPAWVSEFDGWICNTLQSGDLDALLDYRAQAPHALRNHPTEEHLLPLFLALGAAGEGAVAKRIHTSHEYGVLAMDVYAFGREG